MSGAGAPVDAEDVKAGAGAVVTSANDGAPLVVSTGCDELRRSNDGDGPAVASLLTGAGEAGGAPLGIAKPSRW